MSRRVRVVISLVILLFAFMALVACTVSLGGAGPGSSPGSSPGSGPGGAGGGGGQPFHSPAPSWQSSAAPGTLFWLS